jgi:hypothetical protein
MSDSGDKRRLRVKEIRGLRYVYIDYDGLASDQMIALLNELIEFTKKDPIPFIANFSNTKIYPSYLIKGNEWINVTKDLVPFGCFIGLDSYKAFLLESIVSLNQLQHKHFNSLEEAEESLVEFYKG